MGQELRYILHLQLWGEEKAFGPGVAELMERIERTGSVKKACAEMGIAYSKAWKILRRAQRVLGFPLLESRIGGKPGGNTVLTEEGRSFLACYRRFEADLKEYADTCFQRHFLCTHPFHTLVKPLQRSTKKHC